MRFVGCFPHNDVKNHPSHRYTHANIQYRPTIATFVRSKKSEVFLKGIAATCRMQKIKTAFLLHNGQCKLQQYRPDGDCTAIGLRLNLCEAA